MRRLFLATAYDLTVFMTDAADHIAGKTGLTLTITASKAGGSFGSITPTVTELADGWYKLALTTSHVDTLGDLALHITATGADPTDLVMQVVPVNVAANMLQIGGDTQSATDLKDLADIGYDPVSHKVTGVVLVDTTTTNSDMRGTDSAYTGTPPSASDMATAVWGAGTRTLSGFGSLVADIATAVWGAASRILTANTNLNIPAAAPDATA
ncbi:MAG: hypothetical protein ABFD89_04825, partial [Bryobacteraceae bacterium]